MLPSAVKRKRSELRWLRRFWALVLAIFAVMFTAPVATHLVQEVASLTLRNDCCDEQNDGADEKSEQRCPGTCDHCACCAHPNALPPPSLCQSAGQGVACEVVFSWREERPHDSGYRAPPVRPPAS